MRKLMLGEWRSEPKKPLLLVVPGVDDTVGDEAVTFSTLWGAMGTSNDSGGFGTICGEDVGNGEGATRGDGEAESSGGDASSEDVGGLSPGGSAGEPSRCSFSSNVVSSVPSWLVDVSRCIAFGEGVESRGCKPNAERSRSTAW